MGARPERGAARRDEVAGKLKTPAGLRRLCEGDAGLTVGESSLFTREEPIAGTRDGAGGRGARRSS
jgi:hypothetical protein